MMKYWFRQSLNGTAYWYVYHDNTVLVCICKDPETAALLVAILNEREHAQKHGESTT